MLILRLVAFLDMLGVASCSHFLKHARFDEACDDITTIVCTLQTASLFLYSAELFFILVLVFLGINDLEVNFRHAKHSRLPQLLLPTRDEGHSSGIL